MRLDFSGEDVWEDEDDEAYRATRDELVSRFERWLADGPLGPGEGDEDPAWIAANVGIALDWKRSYADGLLTSWPLSDAYELLLEWMPRKVSTDADGGEEMATTLAWFVDFLDGEGLLAGGSASPDDMMAFVSSRRPEIQAAMEDPSNFGLAKSLFGGTAEPPALAHTDASAADLLRATDGYNFLQFSAEVDAWRDARDPAQAAAELADAALELEDPALQNLAVALTGDLGAEVAEPHLRRVADADRTGEHRRRAAAFARVWLVDEGLDDPSVQYDPDDLDTFVELLAARLVLGGPEGLVETFALAGDDAAQLELLDRLWRRPNPTTVVVLTAVGKAHPAKAVAKAARKATHKWETTQRR